MRGTTGIPWTAQNRTPVRATCADPPCGRAFVALCPHQRYCCPACANRAGVRRYLARWGWRGKPRGAEAAS